ncbi:MAG: 6-bladed beta-propeller [Aquificae bacterium]|nr:6-bladed beta-propeller [Aquificota bacterium]
MRGPFRLFPLFLFFLYLFACGPTQKPQQTEEFVWPPPPEKPRIKYLGSYRGESDFRKEGFLGLILGEETVRLDLVKPYGVWAKDHKIYVSDTGLNTIVLIDTKNKKVKPIGVFGALIDVEGDAQGRIYASDAKAGVVYALNEEGKILKAFGWKKLKKPTGLAVDDKRKRLYVVDTGEHNVKVFNYETGELLFTIGRRGTGDGEFNFPTNVAVDRRNGNLVVVDSMNFRVQIFSPEGKFIRKFGRVGNTPGSFYRPKGVGVDSEGHIYVADAAFDNFQIFDEYGNLLMWVGQAGSGPGQFHLPAGLYVDEKDRIFVVDQFNRRVQVFQYLKESGQ